ncbi:hypothetical protein [Actinomadura sp. DC4]|uniref:hypothetical protein n=1 Tax=Actinomadura sp. DC4 TaxID=3055069 RepID=UPI0025B05816|nr:hypothetical protein [Actinomadura sp. DC4]MDN3358583.1 hypothetical protein [Actinomadura sp. DC4]
MPTFSIFDRGLCVERRSPDHALDDVAARRDTVLQALEILRPVVRPLAIEITMGSLDPETFASDFELIRRVASRTIPAGVAHQSAFAESPEAELVDSLTPDVVLEALTPAESDWDIHSVRALVTAARTEVANPRIDRMPSLEVPTLEMDGERWLVGPVDEPGYRLQPPISLRWQQERGELRLSVEAFWSLWWQLGSAEHTALREAERALDESGFQVD